MPKPNKGESQEEYMKRFMSSDEAKKDYPDEKQRYAVGLSMWKKHSKQSDIPMQLIYNVPIAESGMLDNDFLIQGTAINSTITSNNHQFLGEELRESASTLTGVPLLVDHDNRIESIKGRVIKGEYDEANSRVNFKAKVKDTTIKQMIKDGLINSVSVGASVREIEEASDGILIPRGICFKELSLVAVPADAGATFTTALAEAYKTQPKSESVSSLSQPTVEATTKTEIVIENPIKENTQKIELEIAPLKETLITQDILPENKEVITTSQVSNELKGGLKMSEEIKVQEKVIESETSKQMKEMLDKMDAMAKELVSLKASKEAPLKAEVKEEITEKDKYQIVSGFGSIKGHSFTLVR